MDAAETFEQLSARLSHEFPTITRGRIEGIIVEEHDLLIGLRPGDIVPGIVAGAVIERLERELARLRSAASDIG
jgi:hypothetical protein